jgi:hypothetical protein
LDLHNEYVARPVVLNNFEDALDPLTVDSLSGLDNINGPELVRQESLARRSGIEFSWNFGYLLND